MKESSTLDRHLSSTRRFYRSLTRSADLQDLVRFILVTMLIAALTLTAGKRQQQPVHK